MEEKQSQLQKLEWLLDQIQEIGGSLILDNKIQMVLEAENEQLRAENEQLKKENKRLQTEKELRKAESSQSTVQSKHKIQIHPQIEELLILCYIWFFEVGRLSPDEDHMIFESDAKKEEFHQSQKLKNQHYWEMAGYLEGAIEDYLKYDPLSKGRKYYNFSMALLNGHGGYEALRKETTIR